MSKPLPFTFTNESITVVHNGKPTVVQKGAPNFLALRTAIMEENWDEAIKHLTIKKSIKAWAKGKFSISEAGDKVYYDGKLIPSDISSRIIEMATRNEDPVSLFKFYERLQQNPSWRSVQQLYPFLRHQGIPFTEDGCFLAYKGVRSDYMDKHSGRFDNSPGQIHEMPRNQISDDPKEACHEGFHVGALSYAGSFGPVVVICKVAPEDVVCVPYDSSQQKMRVCKYEVIGNHNGDSLPSTSFKEDVSDAPDDEEESYLEEGSSEVDEVDSAEDKPKKKAKKPKASNTAVDIPAKFNKIHALDMAELMQKSLDELRQYATYGLKIVGASKISGGKTALVGKILEVRKTIKKKS